MDKHTMKSMFCTEGEAVSLLEKIVREGAQKMLQAAVDFEVAEFISKYENLRDTSGKRVVTRNGYMPERSILSGIGSLKIKQPRVDDRKLSSHSDDPGFTSKILPRYLRRMPSVDALIPALYLKGVSSQDFPTALSAILGDGVKGLSANTIVRLKRIWEDEFKQWSKRSLAGKEYVYFWVDGIYFNVRLDDERSCILIIVGADNKGNKELIAVNDGYRESKIAWKEMLIDLKKRGLTKAPKLAIGDGALGFWDALPEVFPITKRQRCWVHKTANILDKMPKGVQSKAKSMIHEMPKVAETKKSALKAYDHFISTFKDKYPKAVECLAKDKDVLFTFYDFPSVHWIHIRTTNPIESTFATVRHRTKRTKGCGSRIATLTMVFKLTMEAQKTWKKLKGYKLLELVIADRQFVDGELVEEDVA